MDAEKTCPRLANRGPLCHPRRGTRSYPGARIPDGDGRNGGTMPEYNASCDELIAAGYADWGREDIPKDWRTHRPSARSNQYHSRDLVCECGSCETCKAREEYRARDRERKAKRQKFREYLR